ncbi:PIN domain-like protein [Auriculariales sp. MPI-PUGE-AT-0066]|nr:PIN domain-like protein [Auriculariales sp. MPI-PUGE-AT-0066]
MGIQGLLPFLQPIQKATHLKHFKGKTIGVDAYVWLHRGAYACTAELVLGTPTTKYVDFAMSRVRLLEHNGANPLIVFDGGPLPAKKPTDEKRKMQRKEALGQARAFNAQGRHSQARELYGKALDVTPEVAYQFIKALKAAGVPYIVAPYEADAQLAFLSKSGIIDAVLTEDSDLLVFGVQEALFKLDASGTCMRVSRADFGLAELGMTGWDMSRFREMAMLSGCDYLPNIPGMGLKTAHKMIKKYHNVEKVLTAVRFEGKRRIPSDYLVRFRMAERAFLHQRVWDPSQGRLVCLEDLPEGDVQAAMDAADLAEAGDDTVDPDAYIGRELNLHSILTISPAIWNLPLREELRRVPCAP